MFDCPDSFPSRCLRSLPGHSHASFRLMQHNLHLSHHGSHVTHPAMPSFQTISTLNDPVWLSCSVVSPPFHFVDSIPASHPNILPAHLGPRLSSRLPDSSALISPTTPLERWVSSIESSVSLLPNHFNAAWLTRWPRHCKLLRVWTN